MKILRRNVNKLKNLLREDIDCSNVLKVGDVISEIEINYQEILKGVKNVPKSE